MHYKFVLSLSICILISGCSAFLGGQLAKITVKVVDETGNIVKEAKVAVGFIRDTSKGGVENAVRGIVSSDGTFIAEGRTNGLVGGNVKKDGYYDSTFTNDFYKREAGKWKPWNPVVTVVMRRIEKPVPMYARRFEKALPLKFSDIGCDLTANDWVRPYGNGIHSDITFHLKKHYVNEYDYSADLTVKFSGKNDGFVKYDMNMYNGSKFKLPRNAPTEGYQKQLSRHVIRPPGRPLQDDQNDNNGYIFRVRSSSPNSVMYGKIQKDIEISANGKGTAVVAFTYYLNPDHTRNLEFDPKRNLFTGLKSFEQVGM